MAHRVQRSAALLVAAIVLSGCEQGGPFGAAGGAAPNPTVSQTGTQTVKARVQQLRADQQALAGGIAKQQELLSSTRNQIASDSSSYSSLMGSITSRLQAGTTPGNPELVAQWNDAQAKLDAITMQIGVLNTLATQVTTQASVAGYLVDNVRATYAVGGAVEDDHRALRSIESDTSRSIQDVDRLIGDLNAEISRQNGYLARERANLAAISYGINVGRLGGYYDLKYYKRCTVFICNTPDIADHVVREGKPSSAVHYIPNFCAVAPQPAIHPDTLGTPAGTPILLVLARLQPAKGIDTAIKALADIPDAVMWIAGDGPLHGALTALVEDCRVADRVRFLGWRDDRSALLKAATAVIVPSRHEPFGNVVVNAWAHGTPLIATRSEGPGYLVRDGEDGLLVPVDDAQALADAARRVIVDRALAQHLVAGGTRRVAAEFSEDAVVARYLEVFADIRP